MSPALALLVRDVKLAWREGGAIGVALGFYLVVVAIMPFGLGPDLNLLARINTELAHTKLTPKEQVFSRERLGVLQWALPFRCEEEQDLSRKDQADIKVRFAWIGEALKQGHSSSALPDSSRYITTSSVEHLVFQATCHGKVSVNPHLARALHTALRHIQLSNGKVGLEIEIPMKPSSGWLGSEVMGDPVY